MWSQKLEKYFGYKEIKLSLKAGTLKIKQFIRRIMVQNGRQPK